MKFANSRRFFQITVMMVIVMFFLPVLADDKKPSGDKAAVVNGFAITRDQYDKELQVHLQRLSRQGQQISDDQMAELKEEILDALIEREVLYQESQKAGIKVDDQRVNDQLAAIRKRFPSDEEFKKALNDMDLTEEEIKIQIQHGLAIQDLIDHKVAHKIVIKDEETRAYYDGNPQFFQQPEQVKASHILIKVEPAADEAAKNEARKKMAEVQQKLKDGGDFSALAREYSQGPSSASGGDLGYFGRGQMVKPFEDVAFSMKTNEVSDVVETRFGYHIIKVYDKNPEQTLAYADVKDKIAQRLKQEKVEKNATQYIEDLKTGAKVEKTL